MPTQAFGAYAAEGTAGDEVSSSYEGRQITLLASEINHGDAPVVTKGLPVVFGTVAGNMGVGIPFATEVLGTERIAIDTEGIWNVSVLAMDDAGGGGSLVTGGDPLFISTATCIVSKIRNNATQIPFGYALGQVAAGDTAVIAVKVHWDPRSHWLEDLEKLYFGDDRDVSVEWTGSALEMLPLGDNIDFLIGDGTNSFDVQIFGMSANDFMLWDSAVARLDVINTAVGPDARMIRFHSTVAAPAMTDGEGVINKLLTVTGPATLHIFGESSWINLGAAAECPENMMVRCDGIWDGGVSFPAAQSFVAYEKYTLQLGADPHWNSLWNLNFSGAGSEVDCIFTCNDPGLCLGYEVGGAAQAAGIGSVPLFSTSDGQLRYVYVHAVP